MLVAQVREGQGETEERGPHLQRSMPPVQVGVKDFMRLVSCSFPIFSICSLRHMLSAHPPVLVLQEMPEREHMEQLSYLHKFKGLAIFSVLVYWVVPPQGARLLR